MLLMSNNQWKCDKNTEAWAAAGEDCSAEARVPLMVKAYLEVMPDILGLQEVSRRQAKIMMDLMSKVDLPDGTVADYEYVSGSDTPIVYRRDKLKLLESGFFRFTESVPGYEGSFNNGETKSYAWGVFEFRDTKKKIALLSTHLWYKSGNPESAGYQAGSNEARRYQLMQAVCRMNRVIAEYECPGIIMGDLNANINSLALRAAEEDGWTDVYRLAKGFRDETRGHHYCNPKGYRRDTGGTFEQAIDHILAKNLGNCTVESFRRLTPEYFDKASDHYPLYIELSI